MNYSWSEVRARAIEAFDGEYPEALTEQDIIDAFKVAPSIVSGEIDGVAAKKRAGKIRSGWAIWRIRVKDAAPPPEIIANDEIERDRAVDLARKWMNTVGIHYDREQEVLAELFEDGFGASAYRKLSLAPFDTPALREEMLDLWRQKRPMGEQLEREHVERMVRHRVT